jgi:hypothetical protein
MVKSKIGRRHTTLHLSLGSSSVATVNNHNHSNNMSSPEASPAVAVSGMALSIRQAVDSETFDLAGCNQQTLQTLVKDAFGEPVVSVTGVPSRITLVTGAGKLGRQKYDASCAKIMTNGLMALGYVEDKGASAIFECSGTFKVCHDTGTAVHELWPIY